MKHKSNYFTFYLTTNFFFSYGELNFILNLRYLYFYKMKQFVLLFLSLIVMSSADAQIVFDDFFEEKTLRVDFSLTGNAEKTEAWLQQLVEEPYWGGRQARLDTSLRLGSFLMLLKDKTTGKIIYEEGFATLFEEWQDTEEASMINASFPNSVVMPYPKKNCQFYILRRQQGIFNDTILSVPVVSGGKEIVKAALPHFRVDAWSHNTSPKQALDIVILAEGFQKNELRNFRKLSHELCTTLLSSSVFDENRERINFYAVSVVSEESGVDDPLKDIWRNSYFNASFNTLYSDRYLMVKDVQKVRSVAALVPYDQIYIIVNTEKYGGGGVYNFYSICSAYGHSQQEVLIHEFGHGLAALADEYYYDDNIMINYIDTMREPWQKNITTLVDFDSKWADMIEEGTPIPTPLDSAAKYPVGVYEGAAYVSKGVYRSSPDCRMKTNEAKDFCPVCRRCILEVIDFITE